MSLISPVGRYKSACFARDRKEDGLQACLLAKNDEVEGLPRDKALGHRCGLEIVDVGNLNFEADRDGPVRRNACLTKDRRIGVSIVDETKHV